MLNETDPWMCFEKKHIFLPNSILKHPPFLSQSNYDKMMITKSSENEQISLTGIHQSSDTS